MNRPITQSLVKPQIASLVQAALTEDLGHGGDITSALIFDETDQGEGVIAAREIGVLAGVPLVDEVFAQLGDEVKITWKKQDGDVLKPKDIICTLKGPIRTILTGERVALNFLGHLSGIASLTAEFVAKTKGTKARIAATRKTTPLLRALEKYAVQMGGGLPHRYRLDDGILIKDNHIALKGGMKKLLPRIQATKSHTVKLEVEVDTLDQLKQLLDQNIDIVLLDNMTPATLKKAVQLVDGKMICEASGGVSLETVANIAKTGVDVISVGALTHSAKNFDFGLDIQSK